MDNFMKTEIIHMEDGTEIELAISAPSTTPRAVVLYLHTVCGTYSQLAHMGMVLRDDNIAYITYTRAGNSRNCRKFSKFNFIGRIDELQLVLSYISRKYPDIPIHAVGASAGSALLIRYLGKYNGSKIIKSAVLVSPGYNLRKSFDNMNGISKAYLVNKMKYTIRSLPCKDDLKSVKTLDDWVRFQSRMLGYGHHEEFIQDTDPIYFLDRINVPSLFISSLDDGIFEGHITQTFTDLPRRNENITLVITKRGGHVIFEDEGHDYPWFMRVIREWVIKKIP